MEFLSWRHSIASDKQTALRGRLQHLQRYRFPPGSNTGRGKRVAYDWDHLILLAIAFDMLELGLSPDLIVETLNAETDNILDSISGNDDWQQLGIVPVPKCVMVLEMAALHPLKDDTVNFSYGLYILTNDKLVEHLSGMHIRALKLPISIIDLRGIVRDLMTWLSDSHCIGVDEVYRSFANFFHPGVDVSDSIPSSHIKRLRNE